MPSANDEPKPAIVTSTSRKQTKSLRAAEWSTTVAEDPEANARIRAWLERAKWGGGH